MKSQRLTSFFITAVGIACSLMGSTASADDMASLSRSRQARLELRDLFPKSPSNQGSGELKTSALPIRGKGLLTVRFEQKPVCSFGDLDALQAELTASRVGRLLLSVECLDCNEPGSVVRLGPQILQSKTSETQLVVPSSGRGHVYGIFICKDNDETKSCRDKTLMTIDQVLVQYSPARAEQITDPDFLPSDKTYYFAHAVFGQGNGTIFVNRHGQRERRATRAALESLGVESDEATSALKIMNRYHDTLGSIQPRVEDGRLVIELPVYDRVGCNKRLTGM